MPKQKQRTGLAGNPPSDPLKPKNKRTLVPRGSLLFAALYNDPPIVEGGLLKLPVRGASRGLSERSLVVRYSESRALRQGAEKPSERYQLRHPYPSYSQFGTPDFVDAQRRQYKIADGGDAIDMADKGLIDPAWWEPAVGMSAKRQMLYIRMLKGTKNVTAEVPRVGELIEMHHLGSVNTYVFAVDSISGLDATGRATGSMIVSNVLPTEREISKKEVKELLPGKLRKFVQ